MPNPNSIPVSMMMLKTRQTLSGLAFSLALGFVLSGCGAQDSGNFDNSLAAELSMSDQIVFPQTPVGSTKTVPVKLKNAGKETLQIRNIRLKEKDNDDAVELKKGPNWFNTGKISPGSQKTLKLKFAPKNPNAIEGRLVVECNCINANSNGLIKTKLRAPRLSPSITSRSPVRFSRVAPGETAKKTIEVQNAGHAPLLLEDALLKKTDSPFSIDIIPPGKDDSMDARRESSSLPVEKVDPTESFNVEIEFSPQQNGPKQNSLLIWSNARNQKKYSINLMGNSNTPCLKTLFGDSITFGEKSTEKRHEQTAIVKNCSDSTPLKVKNIALKDSADGIFELNGLPSFTRTIPPGEQMPFGVEFAPTRNQDYSGSLVIESNDPIKPEQTFDVTGRGNIPYCDGPQTLKESVDPVIPTVVLVIDRSSSMSRNFNRMSRWDAAYEALMGSGGLVKKFENRVRFGLSLYTGGGSCPTLTTVKPSLNNYSKINSKYASKGPSGNTPTSNALKQSTSLFKDVDGATEGPKVMLLATDGEPDTCAKPNPQTGQDEAVRAAKEAHQNKDINTFVLSVGNDVSDEHLQDMANVGIGRPSDAQNAAPFSRANNSQKLKSELEGLIQRSGSCTIGIDAAHVRAERAKEGHVKVNGERIQHGSTDGWTFHDSSPPCFNSSKCIQFHGKACNRVRSSQSETEITTRFPCGPGGE